VPALNASSVLIEVGEALSIHLDPHEALQLIGSVHAALHALTSTSGVHDDQLALFDSRA